MSSGKFWTRNTKSAKISALQVMEMRVRYRQQGITQGRLAAEYGLSVIQVGRIVRGESWQDVPELQASQNEMQASLERLMKTQQETSRDIMAEEIAKAKEKATRGDRYVEELKGEGK